MQRVLAVDDEPVNLYFIEETLKEFGYKVTGADSGEAALSHLAQQRFDLVLMDRIMPGLDGITVLRRMKGDAALARIPVIMQTAASSSQDLREGIEAGAHYYLTKPFDAPTLIALVRSVLADVGARHKLEDSHAVLDTLLRTVRECSMDFRTLEDALSLSAALSRLCPDPDAVVMGLVELTTNAIEHGNLGITYAEKSTLKQEDRWEEEVQRRLRMADYRERHATLAMHRDDAQIVFTITDEGMGFDWQPYLDFDPQRAFDLNGRGIAMARQMAFASLEYRGSGNEVVAVVSLPQKETGAST